MKGFDMKRELLAKLASEEPLSAAEVFQLEEALEDEQSLFVSDMVMGLPDHEPSLSWRSDLNQKLVALRPEKVGRSRWFGSRWMVGGVSAVAASVMLFVFVVMPRMGDGGIASDPQYASTSGSAIPADGIVGDSDDLSLVLVRAHEMAEVEASSGIQVPRRAIDPGYDWESLSQ